ncbi:MAG: shikimate kinase [Paludibacteraceae bacterium]
MRVFLIGYMGSGKTTIGKVVAKRLGLGFVDMDAHIENREHKSVAQIFCELGEAKFRELERKCLHEVSEYDEVVISTGGGSPCYFDNMEVMNRQGISIYLNLSSEQLAKRLRTTNLLKRPILAQYKGKDLEKFISDTLEKREIFYGKAHLNVDGTDEEIADKIVDYLMKNQDKTQ